MTRDDIEAKISDALGDARVSVTDLTGARDHWKAVVISPRFEGKSAVERHRMVFDALRNEMMGPIHALTLETLTPDQALTTD